MRQPKTIPTTIIVTRRNSDLFIMMIGHHHKDKRGHIIINDGIATAVNNKIFQRVIDRLDIYDRTKCPGVVYLDKYDLSLFLWGNANVIYSKPTIRELILWRQCIAQFKKINDDSGTTKFIEI